MGRPRFLLVLGGLLAITSACGSPQPAPTPVPTPTVSPVPSPTLTATAAATLTVAPGATPTKITDPVLRGQSLASRFGCAACHSTDGSALVGPTWKGLFGSEEELADGSTVIVDESYIRESILDPNAQITKGFPADVMPQDYAEKLSEADIEAIIAYMKTLE